MILKRLLPPFKESEAMSIQSEITRITNEVAAQKTLIEEISALLDERLGTAQTDTESQAESL